mmetsp:Transcript_318/g.630  ORF Transcript_318/g.630 Transcript_318/m.630 type:complete len:260 (+) Transcript_318:148-927(+)
MMASSTHRPLVQAAVCALAVYCIASLFDSQNDTQNGYGLRSSLDAKEYSRGLVARVPTTEDPDSFWYDDIRYDETKCGRFKCFFTSLSDPAKGYLVFVRKDQAWSGYNFSKRMEAEHGITQFYSDPPFQTKVPESFRDGISEVVRKRLWSTNLWVQPSRTAPEGAQVFKCFRNSKVLTLEYLRKHAHEGCKERLLEGLANTITFVKSVPTLINDFQFMVDLDGNIYQIDLDRANRPGFADPTRVITCLEHTINSVKKSM